MHGTIGKTGCHVRMSTALLTAAVLVAVSMAEEDHVTYAKYCSLIST